MGCNYTSRLDNEDVINMLMKKLPNKYLNRKWVDRAGDLIKSKGRAEYSDFVSFVRKAAERINNRYEQELKSSKSSERGKKEFGKVKAGYPPIVKHLILNVKKISIAQASLPEVP